jgi:hypothetical protein
MQSSAVSAAARKGSCVNYGYICIFLVQLFVLVACGSYINTAIVLVAWTIVVMTGHEQNVVVSAFCAISVVLQTYAFSINSQHVLLISTPRQRACETIGIAGIESLYQRNNIFRSCDADLFVPFIPQQTYALQRDQNIQLMYGGGDAVMHMGSCHTLGVGCYRWNVLVQGFGMRRFEPCWPLVRQILTTNASSVVMVHRSAKNTSVFSRNIKIPPATTLHTQAALQTPFAARFIHFSSRVQIPLQIAPTAVVDTKELQDVPLAPDSDTVFVVVPTQQGQPTSMHLSLEMRCPSHELGSPTTSTDSLPFFHSGVMHLAEAATPAGYTVYAAFSECGRSEGVGCNSRLLTSFAIYTTNIVLCLSCVMLTHGCVPCNTHQYSVVYVFACVTAVVTFNWIAIVCIYCVHPASHHGGISHLNRLQQIACFALYVAQGVLLISELVQNQLGSNTHFMLSRMHQSFGFGHLLLPFTLLDSNVYIANSALYLCSSAFIAHLLYLKCGAQSQ